MSFTDPIALFQSALDALNAENWFAAAQHCDPVSLRVFQREMVGMFAPPRPEYELTPELLMRDEPTMPRAVAEYQAAQYRQRADSAERLRWELPGISSVEEVAACEPVVLFASWIQGRSPRSQVLRLIALGFAPAAATPGPIGGYPGRPPYYDFAALGAVFDGEHAAHVVYRDQMDETVTWSGESAKHLAALPADEQELSRLTRARGNARVAFCRRQEDRTWRLIADHQFMGVSSRHISSVGVSSEA